MRTAYLTYQARYNFGVRVTADACSNLDINPEVDYLCQCEVKLEFHKEMTLKEILSGLEKLASKVARIKHSTANLSNHAQSANVHKRDPIPRYTEYQSLSDEESSLQLHKKIFPIFCRFAEKQDRS